MTDPDLDGDDLDEPVYRDPGEPASDSPPEWVDRDDDEDVRDSDRDNGGRPDG